MSRDFDRRDRKRNGGERSHAELVPGKYSSAALLETAEIGPIPPSAMQIGAALAAARQGTPTALEWIRVSQPADASVEEVAAALFAYTAENYGEKNTSFLAYGTTAVPPLFALAASWAMNFKEAHDHAPPVGTERAVTQA